MQVGVWDKSNYLFGGTYQSGSTTRAVISRHPLPGTAKDWVGRNVDVLRGNNVAETTGTIVGVDLSTRTVFIQ